MKKWIDDLFRYPRTINDLEGSLDYINNIIPIKKYYWRTKERCGTWIIPDGGIQIGVHSIKGEEEETILFPIHLDHPKMANDNLSGVVVSIGVAQNIINPRYSYKFIFLPETIGTMAFLSKFKNNFKYGIVIDSVGGDGDLVTTLPKSTSLLPYYVNGRVNDFLSDAHLWSGNDERVLESIGIPSIQISRSPFLEYHSERDTPDKISEKQLLFTMSYVLSIINKIELDFIPIPSYWGVPCLSTNGLWKKEYESPHTFIKVEKIWQLIGHGLHISEIAHYSGNSFEFVYDFIKQLQSKNLIKK